MGSRRVKKVSGEPVDPWLLNDTPVLEIPEGEPYGFIYEIECKSTGEKYIGKKAFHSYHTKISRVLNERTGRMNKVREVEATESNWKIYFGSSIEIKDLVKAKGKQDFTRKILALCKTKKELTFREVEFQCKANVLEKPEYINSNILGKFFRSDFV